MLFDQKINRDILLNNINDALESKNNDALESKKTYYDILCEFLFNALAVCIVFLFYVFFVSFAWIYFTAHFENDVLHIYMPKLMVVNEAWVFPLKLVFESVNFWFFENMNINSSIFKVVWKLLLQFKLLSVFFVVYKWHKECLILDKIEEISNHLRDYAEFQHAHENFTSIKGLKKFINNLIPLYYNYNFQVKMDIDEQMGELDELLKSANIDEFEYIIKSYLF